MKNSVTSNNTQNNVQQIIYLDFDGELTSYCGEILTIDNVEVSNSKLTIARILDIIAQLNARYAAQNVIFVTERPQNSEYSTIYIGKTFSFDQYGNFTGLAETIDFENKNKSDKAFVNLDCSASDETIIAVIAHETDHLLGMQHSELRGGLEDYAYTESEGSGNWNDTPDTAHYLGRIYSSINVEGELQSRWYQADQDWYYFYPTTNWLKWSVTTQGLVNTRTIVLFPPTGSGIVLANEDINSRTGVLQVVPGEKYYIHCTDSFSGMGPYKFSLTALNSPGASYTKNCADLTFYKPTGWGGKLVCYPDDSQPNKNLYADINTFLKLAIVNNGKSSAESCVISIFVDNYLFTELSFSSIKSGYYRRLTDIDLGVLSEGKHKITVKIDSDNSVVEKNEKNNVLTKNITVKKAPLPDLKFYKPKGWKSQVNIYSAGGKKFYADENIYVDFAVINKALRSANSSYAYIYVDGVYHNTVNITTLDANYYQSHKVIYLGKLAEGKHKITISLDATQQIRESSEKNNIYSKVITVNKTPLPDLKFYKPKGWKSQVNIYSLSGNKLTSDENIYLDVTVINSALRSAAASTIGVYIDNIHYTDITLTTLSPNTYTSKSKINIGKLSAGKHKITLKLDDDNDVLEKNEKNNSYSKTVTVKEGYGIFSLKETDSACLEQSDSSMFETGDRHLQGTVSWDGNVSETWFKMAANEDSFILDFDSETDRALAEEKLEISCFDTSGNAVNLLIDEAMKVYSTELLIQGSYKLCVTGLSEDTPSQYEAILVTTKTIN